VVADILRGADGINGDYVEPGTGLWSWHVSQFRGFADITAEILDGWPTGVELGVSGWTDANSGQIGFWQYTVKQELGPTVPEPGMALGVGVVVLLSRRRMRGR